MAARSPVPVARSPTKRLWGLSVSVAAPRVGDSGRGRCSSRDCREVTSRRMVQPRVGSPVPAPAPAPLAQPLPRASVACAAVAAVGAAVNAAASTGANKVGTPLPPPLPMPKSGAHGEIARCVSSWAPPAASQVLTLEDLQTCRPAVRGPREGSVVRLATQPPLARAHSTFLTAGQHSPAIGHYVAHRHRPVRPCTRGVSLVAAPAPIVPWAVGRAEATVPGPMPSFGGGGEGDEGEYSEPREDLEGLLEYFEGLQRRGARLTEATYVVNSWSLGGVIPLWHHGFVLRAQDEGYLTLDFSRRGILWDTFDICPELPDSTVFAKKYYIDTDPLCMRSYCEETKPFSWHSNDCHHWARGVMRVMSIMEDPLQDKGAFRAPETADCLLCGGQSLEKRAFPTCLP